MDNLPSHITSQQFKSIVSQSLKGGGSFAGAQKIMKSNKTLNRAMSKSSMTAREAQKAFDVLKKEGALSGMSGKSAGQMYHKAVRVGQEKGFFEKQKTLHQIAVEKRKTDRIQGIKDAEKRKEREKEFDAERAAEAESVTGGVQSEIETKRFLGNTQDAAGGKKDNSIVKIQKHGVAAKADETTEARATASASARVAKKSATEEPKQMLKDIMFD